MLWRLYTNLISLDFNPKRNLNLRLKRSARAFMENLHECTGTVRCYRPRNSHNFIMLQLGLWSLAPNINTRREQLWKTILNQQRQRRRRTMTGSILKLALFAGPKRASFVGCFCLRMLLAKGDHRLEAVAVPVKSTPTPKWNFSRRKFTISPADSAARSLSQRHLLALA